MNNTLNTSFETDFNKALNMCEQNYSYEKLMILLSSEEILEKQAAALRLQEIKSYKDALILASNLAGQNGKVREVVAFKINELIQKENYRKFFISEQIFEKFFEGLTDINGNVCRYIIEGCLGIQEFKKYLCNRLPEQIFKILKQIKVSNADEKQYKISKRNFQLYWCLETLYFCVEDIDLGKLKEIVIKTAEFEDYTIREKTAKILTKISSPEFDIIKEKLKNDENYYVKRFL